MAIATLIGTFVTTWMTGKIARMTAAAVFISLLFWAWLWGVWGMLLGIPIIVILAVPALISDLRGLSDQPPVLLPSHSWLGPRIRILPMLS